jgi:formylglycine-generating enzyme required for sulfatase activity/energy-coupling factor transporter ATP-binding protein EcfA2
MRYEEAKKFFDDLKSVLPEKTLFLFVPGNHDVDRDKVSKFFTLHDIVKNKQTDAFLEEERKSTITVKFESFRRFVDALNPDLYRSENDYFWVKNFEDKNVSFLGLNSCWASENDRDRFNITPGYPQVMNALEMSNITNRILLMHHPPFNWLNEQDFSRYRGEIFRSCGLILRGHNHFDSALVLRDPTHSCICLGANASYTSAKNGFIGFQFITVVFRREGINVRVSPYILDTRERISFFPDTRRWEGQAGKPYFDLDTFQPHLPEPGRIVRALEIPEGYKNWVREFHSTISYDQLAKKGEVLPVQLLEVYIPLETANPFHKAEMARISKGEQSRLARNDAPGKEADVKEPATIDLETLLERVTCILLRGRAGMGKTTLIKHLASTITEGSCQSALRDYLPVMVFLKDLWLVYNEALKKKTSTKLTFEPLLNAYLDKIKCPHSCAVISHFLHHNRALFMFDGLDEIPEEIRDDLVELVAAFQFEHKSNRFLLTGRPHGIAGMPHERFGKYLQDIESLDDAKINDFIKKWFRAVSGKATGLADMTADDMISDITFHEHVSVFTQNPLLLAAVCVLYLGKRIPEQRADLYDRIVENLLWRRFHNPAEPDKVNEVREFLMLLAFEMQKKNLKTFDVGDGLDVLKQISVQKEEEQAHVYQRRITRMFNETEPNCVLLNRLSGGEIEFTHLTFQEFMAAKHLIYMDIDYTAFIESEWWEETILLYTGIKNLTTKEESNQVVKQILNTRQKEEKSQRRLWLLGSRTLRDFQPIKRNDEMVALAREKLYNIIESDASLEERFEAGELVGALGDLRIRKDTMVPVKAGTFMRGSKEDDAGADEKPQREVYLDEFMIGTYPVTNEEFKEFVDDGGYDKEEFWTKEGWRWREENEIFEPAYWHDRKWNGPNFPVVGISWFEAEAYANWLSERTGYRFSLPTEAEWEKAARGTDGLKYPWGEHFDKNLCNLYESELHRTSPVGIYPRGKSPYGCFDMAGNVWERCSDWYDGKYYANSPDRNPEGPSVGAVRVVRGGGWSFNAGFCRSAFRNHFDPRFRGNILGFRLLQEL